MTNENDDVGPEISELERQIEAMNFECMLREQELLAVRQKLLRMALLAERTILGEDERKKMELETAALYEKIEVLDAQARSARKHVDVNAQRIERVRARWEKKKQQ